MTLLLFASYANSNENIEEICIEINKFMSLKCLPGTPVLESDSSVSAGKNTRANLVNDMNLRNQFLFLLI